MQCSFSRNQGSFEMWVQVACEALRSGHVLELRYNGYSRSVEVHAVGFTKEDNPVMRVWQVSGGSVSNGRLEVAASGRSDRSRSDTAEVARSSSWVQSRRPRHATDDMPTMRSPASPESCERVLVNASLAELFRAPRLWCHMQTIEITSALEVRRCRYAQYRGSDRITDIA